MLGDLDPRDVSRFRDALIRCGRALERDVAERAAG